MIPIYIGNAPDGRDKRAIAVLKHSILAHTDAPVAIHLLNRPDSGGTGFSTARWDIPAMQHYDGYAIYLDSDMLVLGDIRELWYLKQRGHWVTSVTYPHGSSAVSVIDCSVTLPVARTRKPYYYDIYLTDAGIMKPEIPLEWNMRNAYLDGTQLIHYTKRSLQPWLVEGDREIDRMWYRYEEDMQDEN
jgi:hypothetical protein